MRLPSREYARLLPRPPIRSVCIYTDLYSILYIYRDLYLYIYAPKSTPFLSVLCVCVGV